MGIPFENAMTPNHRRRIGIIPIDSINKNNQYK